MPATVNERLANAAVSHSVDFHQYSNGVVQRLIATLNKVDADLFAQLNAALERLPPESFTVDRLEKLLYGVRANNQQAYQAVEREQTDTLKQFVAYEAKYQQALFTSTIPPQILANVSVAAVNVESVYAAAMARPFQGVLLKEALAGLEAGRAKSVRDAIRMGYVENQTTSQIVQRIRGTRAKGYADGLFQAPRQHLEAITRTALSHTAAFTRERFYAANDKLIASVVWTATLDSRTSEICILRDGKKYTNETHKPVGHSLPWLGGPGAAHWNCRSTSVPVTKSWKELGGEDLPDFTPSQRASMDGAVPAEQTYGQWLKKQSAARQDEVLGATRGKLLRDGGFTVERFANDKGRWLSIDELRARDARAFAQAGV
jgi:hypothetical protein